MILTSVTYGQGRRTGLEMFYSALDFFLFTGIKWSGIWTAKIATDTSGHGDFLTVMVTTFRTSKPFTCTFKFTTETTFIAFINRCIGPIVRHSVIAIIPNVLQCFKVMLNIWVFTIANKPAACERWIRQFKIYLVIRIDFFLYV